MSAKPVWGWQPRRSLGSWGGVKVRNCENWWREGWEEMSASGWRGVEGNKTDIWQKMGDGSENQWEDGNSEAVWTGEKTWGRVENENQWQMKTQANYSREKKRFSGAGRTRQFICLTWTSLNPAYLVKESLEDAGSFDWQRAGNTDLFFQYYYRERGEIKTVRYEQFWWWNKHNWNVLASTEAVQEHIMVQSQRWIQKQSIQVFF